MGDEVVVVRLGSGRFAISMGQVAEVGRVPVLTRVPGLPSFLAGAANWRGRVLAVVDLRLLLGANPADSYPVSRIAVLTSRAATVGLLVDEVVSTTRIDPDEIAPFPSSIPVAAMGLLTGQVARPEGPIAMLDVDAVMALRESLPRGRRSA